MISLYMTVKGTSASNLKKWEHQPSITKIQTRSLKPSRVYISALIHFFHFITKGKTMLLRSSTTRLLANIISRRSRIQRTSHLAVLPGISLPVTHTDPTQYNNRSMTTSPAAQISNPSMFCRQCEQTQDHIACRSVGICGKTAETSAMQDGLVHMLKSMGLWAVAARKAGATSEEMYETNWWTLRSAFSTLTNVNFDEERIAEVSYDETCSRIQTIYLTSLIFLVYPRRT